MDKILRCLTLIEIRERVLMKIAEQIFIQAPDVTWIGIAVGFNDLLQCAHADHAALIRRLSVRHPVEIFKQIDRHELLFSS